MTMLSILQGWRRESYADSPDAKSDSTIGGLAAYPLHGALWRVMTFVEEVSLPESDLSGLSADYLALKEDAFNDISAGTSEAILGRTAGGLVRQACGGFPVLDLCLAEDGNLEALHRTTCAGALAILLASGLIAATESEGLEAKGPEVFTHAVFNLFVDPMLPGGLPPNEIVAKIQKRAMLLMASGHEREAQFVRACFDLAAGTVQMKSGDELARHAGAVINGCEILLAQLIAATKAG
jgi:hypothetical protein